MGVKFLEILSFGFYSSVAELPLLWKRSYCRTVFANSEYLYIIANTETPALSDVYCISLYNSLLIINSTKSKKMINAWQQR
jgi:hypothetical protein